MGAPDLNEVDFDRIHRWLQRACGAGTPLLLCDAQGGLLQQGSSAADARLAEQLAAQVEAGFAWPFEGGGLAARALGEAGTLLYRPVESATQRIGWLATAVDSGDPGTTAVDALAEAMEDLAVSLGEQARLRSELDGMTEELAERYEELHMVYGVDDHVRHHGHDKRAFELLLRDCARQLEIDVVAYVKPDSGECLWATQLSRPIHNLDLVLVEMRGDLFRFVQATRESLVLNAPDDARRAYVFTDMPYKRAGLPGQQRPACRQHAGAAQPRAQARLHKQ
jgi:hypothetical protein